LQQEIVIHDIPTEGVWATTGVSRVQVAIRIGVRGIESPDAHDNGNHDIPIRDFPTGLRIVVEDRCRDTSVHRHIGGS
jgi:hypothetical protein